MKSLFLALAFSVAAGSAGAATVQNGGFESPGTFNGAFQTIGTGSSALTGWTIASQSVDLINSYWQNGSGRYSLDLSGNGPATISQTITDLTVGQHYRLSFLMAGNPDGAPVVKSLLASIGANAQGFSFDTTGNSRASMGWIVKSFDFTADATSLLLSFSAQDAGPFGPALDDVAISAIPLPAGGALLLAGLGALALTRRRARD